ncbi:DUF3048 domain-containing protein [Sanguibacter sp. YZGR15]|uniref:DUF3048 domain-containing protein n=1 Tax=Sanguibacter suaedae TaxID=2795737 RepID=A0A934M676_9MICO|nr:DUF3048 domain-containing protein [Sanguibacter suaedae]
MVLGACSGDPDPVVTPTETVTAEAQAAKVAPPEPVVPPTWALTGVQSGEIVDRPALAVKVENSREARPQTGLEQADVVWEEIVEGGVTRYVAVYHSQLPETVGPIRSVRPMDAGIAAPLGGLVVFSGGTPPFVQSVRDAGLQVVSHDEGASGFYRVSARRAPHNVYGTTQTFLSQAEAGRATPGAQFVFARDAARSTPAVAGSPVSGVDISMSSYSKPSWSWDEATAAYQRSESGTPAVAASGTRLAATNVVVLRVELYDTQYTDPAGARVPETQMIGSGEALVLSGGKGVTVSWSKPDAASPVALTDAAGQPVKLAPGNTWVELVPTGSGSYTTR